MHGCRHLTRGEVRLMLGTCFEIFPRPNAERLVAMFCLMLATGLRLHEARSLHVEDASNQGALRDRLILRRVITKGKTRGATIPVNELCRVSLERWLEYSGLHTQSEVIWLFPTMTSGSRLLPTYLNQPVHKSRIHHSLDTLKDHLNLPPKVGTHSFRKTFAQAVYEMSGHDIYATQIALRHSEPKTTIRYLAPAEQRTDEVIRRLF